MSKPTGKLKFAYDTITVLEAKLVKAEAQLAAHAEVVEAARSVVEANKANIAADLMTDREYTDDERLEIQSDEQRAIDALATALAKPEAPDVKDTA